MEKSDIKYCITAFIDLLGFSNHLEVGNDLRTNIGKEAIERLNILEDSISLLKSEREKYPEYYPKKINFKRINDSVIFTMDLPEYLTPRIGELIKRGMTLAEMKENFSKKDLESEEKFKKTLISRNTQSILDLTLFVGLISRIHSYISRKEKERYFPGPRTVIASGFRKSFISASNEEDYFSANFSFSNAYIAESKLKGQNLFIDNNILELLGKNKFTRNLLRVSSFVPRQNYFNPFDELDPFDELKDKKQVKGVEQKISLFRKEYLFKEINYSILTYLQLFKSFLPYLTKEKSLNEKIEMELSRDIYKYFEIEFSLEAIENGLSLLQIRLDMEENIEEFKQFVLEGK